MLRTEQNRTEQNRTEQNRTEQNRTEQNRTGSQEIKTGSLIYKEVSLHWNIVSPQGICKEIFKFAKVIGKIPNEFGTQERNASHSIPVRNYFIYLHISSASAIQPGDSGSKTDKF
jgi:hypothetical protein